MKRIKDNLDVGLVLLSEDFHVVGINDYARRLFSPILQELGNSLFQCHSRQSREKVAWVLQELTRTPADMPRTMVVDVLGKVVMFNLSQLDIVTPTPHTYWSVTFIDVSQQTGAEMNPLSGLMEMKKFPVYDNGAYCFLAMDSVHYIQADGDYCKVFTGDKSYYLHLSLKTILQRYSSTTFCQVHKSFIVNLHHVSKVVRNDEGRTQVIFDNTSLPPVPVSRRRLTDLRNALALL